MPSEPELPWLPSTAELPAQPADRRRLVVLMLPMLGLLVLCCGGGLLVSSVFRGGSDKSGAPKLAAPSSSAQPTPTASPSPVPTASPDPTRTAPATTKVSASSRPTTHRPAPTSARPTTTKPRPSAPATSGGIQQNVREGAFCAPPGAIGLTKRGQVLRCGPGRDDPHNRWRPVL